MFWSRVLIYPSHEMRTRPCHDWNSLRSKRFRASSLRIVGTRAEKKEWRGRGRGKKNNLRKARRDRIECEKIFWKAQLVKKLFSFDFWISRHFVTIFGNIQPRPQGFSLKKCPTHFLREKPWGRGNITKFQDAISPKAIELFQNSFHICFYHVTLFQNYLFVLP